jgi:hypothetical protein
MEELQRLPRIATRSYWGVVRKRQHPLSMEGIWTELTPMDPWETSVQSGACLPFRRD